MKEQIEKAKRIASLVEIIKEYEDDLKKIDSTKEFTSVIFEGEDGNEQKHYVSFGWKRNTQDDERYAIAKEIHAYTRNLIVEKIKQLNFELADLVDNLGK